MRTEEKNLSQMHERLRAEYPDILCLHHAAFEDAYIHFKLERKQKEPQ